MLQEAGTLTVVDKPVPDIGPDEVLVQVQRASLCGTDLKIRSRKFFPDGGPPPGTFTPGHEYAGIVAAVGSTVDEFRVGDRVVAEAHRGCGRCPNCLRGEYTECLNYGRRGKGHRALGMTENGGFAEYVVNPVSTLHALPSNVDFDSAVALTTVGTVMHAFNTLSSLVVGSRVAVIGPGAVGLLAVQVARELGAALVVLTGTRDERLAIGTQTGADLVINSRREDPVPLVRAVTDGVGVDIVLECSGAPVAVDQAIRMARRAGRVVLVGFFEEPVLADLNQAVMNGLTISTTRGEGADSLRRATALADRGRLNTGALITQRFKLEDIQLAFDTYADRDQNAIKVMLDIADKQ
jgi:L-iditol 2-dehydrogenase